MEASALNPTASKHPHWRAGKKKYSVFSCLLPPKYHVSHRTDSFTSFAFSSRFLDLINTNVQVLWIKGDAKRFRRLKGLVFSRLVFLSFYPTLQLVGHVLTYTRLQFGLLPKQLSYQTEFLFETFPVVIRKDILMMVDCLIPALFKVNCDGREALSGRSKASDILEWEQGC